MKNNSLAHQKQECRINEELLISALEKLRNAVAALERLLHGFLV